jgi:hypothetical protein
MPSLRFTCPKCTQIIECPDTNAGKKVACPICKAQLRVPAIPSGIKATPRSSSAPSRPAPLDELEEVEEEPLDVLPVRSPRRDEEILDVEAAEPEVEEGTGKKRKATARLGKELKTYSGSTAGNIILMIVCGLLALGGLVFIPLGIIGKEPGFIIGSVLMIPLGIIGCVAAYYQLGFKVIVHEGGLLQVRRTGERVIPWEDIECVWQQITEHYTNGIYTGTTYTYNLRLRDGSRLKYSNYTVNNVKKLGEIILHETSQVLYPKAMKAYNKGKTVDFGKLGISEDGLSYGSSLLTWDEIEAVRIKKGYIHVRKRDKWLNWCNIPFSTVPNPLVFISLVNQIVGIDDG